MEIGLYNYKSYAVSPLCLGSDAVVEAVTIANYYSDNTGVTFLQALQSFYNLYYHVDKYCPFNVILNNILNFYANPNNDTGATTVL
jgi:hypothetical protein